MADFEYRGVKVTVEDEALADRLPSNYAAGEEKKASAKRAPAKSDSK